MTPKQITSRYRNWVIGGSLAYIGAVVGTSSVVDKSDPLTLLTLAAAFLPGFALLITLYAMWRFLNDTDEVGRFFMMRSLTAAFFATLAVCGVWGLAELFLDALPRLPVFFVFPIGMAFFGIFSGCGVGWKGLNKDEGRA